MIHFPSESHEPTSLQYLRHSAAALEDDNGEILGELIMSTYEAGSAEADGAGTPFIARPDSYLWRYRECLFDENSPSARLPATLREMLQETDGRLILLDDWYLAADYFSRPGAQYRRFQDVIHAVLESLAPRCDMVVIPRWAEQAKHLDLISVEFLEWLQIYGMTPFRVHYVVGLTSRFQENKARHAHLIT